MAKEIQRTEENKKVLLWTHLRLGKNSKGKKISIVVNDCKLEYTAVGLFDVGWVFLSFVDPFSGDPVTVKRKPSSIIILNPERSDYGISGFEGFKNRPKRKKPAPKPKLAPERHPALYVEPGFGGVGMLGTAAVASALVNQPTGNSCSGHSRHLVRKTSNCG